MEIELIFIVDTASLPTSEHDVTGHVVRSLTDDALHAAMGEETSAPRRLALWNEVADRWTKLCIPADTIGAISGTIATLNDLGAALYLSTDALDLDHLSNT